MIPIKSEQLRVALLSHLIHLLDMGEVETLLDAGLSPDLLDTLRTASVRDLNAIAGMSQLDVSVHFAPATLEAAYRRHEAMTESRQLMEYHVQHGAHPQLLVHLFKMTMEQIREQRALLCPEPQARGRPPLPKPEVREAVQQAWPRICSSYPPQRQYVELHYVFPDLSIATLWYVVHEFDDCETA
ncbi:DUF2857 family protein [Aromatoleum toluvorans]|uniref:DUF2857 family protein n=2 Tax=Aromatoleum toluvorans TaxID=92002 RepID=A0ABX1PSA3_9RHOO|nr:STY4526/YPO1902 family pathogenicity island replication protein [Aromatoleum toluvorans]NMG42317.1 DUF2857 family protein [Aromatoleum toluvorans]